MRKWTGLCSFAPTKATEIAPALALRCGLGIGGSLARPYLKTGENKPHERDKIGPI